MTWGDDVLRLDELVPAGGTWSGLLFENERTGFPLSLVWQFTFDFGEVHRDFGGTNPSLSVDWVPLPGADWSAMEGHAASASQFASPIESSVYFFEHHRYDSTSLTIRSQENTRLLVDADVGGDVDSLGLDRVRAEAWLDFGRIVVQPESKPGSMEAATELLDRFTSTSGLTARDGGHNFVFEASDGPAS